MKINRGKTKTKFFYLLALLDEGNSNFAAFLHVVHFEMFQGCCDCNQIPFYTEQ